MGTIRSQIHYLFRYREEVARDGDVEAAIVRSHGSIGTSILYTSLTTVVGFSVLALSNFRPNAYFGILTLMTLFMQHNVTMVALGAWFAIFLMAAGEGVIQPAARSGSPS